MDTKELRLTALKSILGKIKGMKSSKPTVTITEEKSSVGGSPLDNIEKEVEGEGTDMSSLLKSLKEEMGGGDEEKDSKDADWKKLLKEHAME